MFDSQIYIQRRNSLKKQLGSGVALFLGNDDSPMNYPANPYRFRQDSSFCYFFGLDSPGLVGVIDVGEDRDIIFGNDVGIDDIIWMGPQPLLKERALEVGVKETAPMDQLAGACADAIQKGKKVHFLPPYRTDSLLRVEKLLGIHPDKIKSYVSVKLIKAVVDQRAVKMDEEIDQIEMALKVTHEMHTAAMRLAKPEVKESEIAGKIEGIALSHDCSIAFPIILTVNGQILHNHFHGNTLEKGQLLVNDSGAESSLHYAADITRTMPVGGKFSPRQKEIYGIVLNAQETAIQAIRPGLKNKDIHLKAVTAMASGLKELGLMKGDVEEAVKAGAHALFMPHGLGHMLGLDVHDMEDLGENHVGYDKNVKRSDQFGLAYLRLGRELKTGFVLTVEPGIYFIPTLIDKFVNEKKFMDFIDYKRVEEYRNFGGIRIEDDVLVTEKGYRVLGHHAIPKKVSEIEETMASG